MAVPSGKQYGSGFRHARFYLLNDDARPAATATTPYIGMQAAGARAFEVTIPPSRRLAHVGDDRLMATTKLPRIEVSNAVIRAARNDFDLIAMLAGIKVAELGESVSVGYGTDLQGYEPNVCAMLTQATIDADSGLSHWRTYIVPVTQAVANPGSFGEQANEYTFELTLSPVKKYPWGIAFALAEEGYRSAEVVEANTKNPVMLTSWLGDNTEDNFLFDVDHQPPSIDKIHVITVDGVVATPTKATTGLTFVAPPATGAQIVCYHETAVL